MKLSYKTPGGAGNFTTLADEADRVTTLELFAPSFSPAVQVEPTVRAASVSPFDRGNVAVSLQIVCTITYDSYAAALASLVTFRTAFAGKRHLKIEEGTTAHYFPNAVCTGYTPVLTGVTVRHQLAFTSQDLTTTQPT